MANVAEDPSFPRRSPPGSATPTLTEVISSQQSAYASEGSFGSGEDDAPQRYVTDHEHAAVLVTSDFLAACLALPVALLILAGISNVPVNSMRMFTHNLSQNGLFPVAVVVALAAAGMYRSARRALQPSTFTEMKDLFIDVGAGGILFLGVGAIWHIVFNSTELVVSQLLVAVLVAGSFVVIGRAFMRAAISRYNTTRVLVVGSGPLEDRIKTYLNLHRGMELVGRVVDADTPDAGALGTVADLPALCDSLRINRLIVGFPDRGAAASVGIYRGLQGQVHIAIVPRYFELISWRSRMTDLCGLPMLEVASPNLSRWDRGIKRAFDIALASFAVAVLSPVFLAVALAVRFSSPGPVLFRQVRLGRNQHPFRICKFRTMNVHEESGGTITVESHPSSNGSASLALHELRNKAEKSGHITRIGGFLRKTALDELPQLFNVIRGDMSIVGPRPFVPDETELEGLSARRFEVRPGITGLWQVSGRNDLSAEDLRQLDYLYVASWTMWSDLRIVWDTPKTMVQGTGAY